MCCGNAADRSLLLNAKTSWGNPAVWSSWDAYYLPCGSPGWEGVECNWQGSVARLNFSGMGLSGTLPQYPLQLSSLEVLDLSGNSLFGSLPDVFSGGDKLQVLDLSRNSLSGTMPSTWRNMRSLQSLDLSYNQLVSPAASWLVRGRERGTKTCKVACTQLHYCMASCQTQ
jgi:hypothetical protein